MIQVLEQIDGLHKIALCILLFLLPYVYLAIRWANPVIIKYPWDRNDNCKVDSYAAFSDKKKTVVLAGSYNPPHKGHLVMIEYLSRRFKEVIVVVGFNPNKVYDVTPEQRCGMLKKMVEEIGEKNVKVQLVKGLIWRFAIKNGASMLVRGIRSWAKDGPDEQHLHFQNIIYPILLGPLWWPIPSLFLESKPQFVDISSTLVRDLCEKKCGSNGEIRIEDLSDLVPKSIAEEVRKYYSS